MNELERACLDLVSALHDEIRKDIPDVRLPMVGKLKPPPWSTERLERLANKLAMVVRIGIQQYHKSQLRARGDWYAA